MSSVPPNKSQNLNELTKLERFSVTNKLIQALITWDGKKVTKGKAQKLQNHVLKPLVVRVLGSVAVVFAAIADTFIHLGLALGKGVAVIATLPVRPFKCVKLPKDLNVSSPFTHLANTVRSVVYIATIPLVMVFSPSQAEALTRLNNKEKIQDLKSQIVNLQADLIKVTQNLNEGNTNHKYVIDQFNVEGENSKNIINGLNDQIKDLSERIGQLNFEILSLKGKKTADAQYSESTINEISRKEAEINSLNAEISKLNAEQSRLQSELDRLDKEKIALQSQINELLKELSGKNLKELENEENSQIQKATIEYLEARIKEIEGAALLEQSSSISMSSQSSSQVLPSISESEEDEEVDMTASLSIKSTLSNEISSAPLPPPLDLSRSKISNILSQSAITRALPPAQIEASEELLESEVSNDQDLATSKEEVKEVVSDLLKQIRDYKKSDEVSYGDKSYEVKVKATPVVNKLNNLSESNQRAFAKLRTYVNEARDYLKEVLDEEEELNISSLSESMREQTLLQSTFKDVKSGDKEALKFRVDLLTIILDETDAARKALKKNNQENAAREIEEAKKTAEAKRLAEETRKSEKKKAQLQRLEIKPSYEDAATIDILKELKNSASWAKVREYINKNNKNFVDNDITLDKFNSEIVSLKTEVEASLEYQESDKFKFVTDVISFINARRYK